jgi:hypothetical protein
MLLGAGGLGLCRLAPGSQLSQPKIQNLGLAPAGDEDIGWFDVAMRDSGRVRGLKAIRDLDSKRNQCVNFKGPAVDPVF